MYCISNSGIFLKMKYFLKDKSYQQWYLSSIYNRSETCLCNLTFANFSDRIPLTRYSDGLLYARNGSE